MPQSLAQVYLHIVFSTKNRVSFFKDDSTLEKLCGYLAGVCKNHDCHAVEIGGADDHIHLLCSLSRQKTIADLIRNVKIASSEWVKGEFHGFSDFHWQDGYGVFSVSRSQLDKVVEYVSKQREHHRTMSFQDEFRALLQKHGVDFNEKYVWD